MFDGFAIAWILWIIAFLIIEIIAVVRKAPNDTLSEKVWAFFSVKDKSKWWRLRRALLAGFLIWLFLHFLSGGVLM
jgi:hypothetical protein